MKCYVTTEKQNIGKFEKRLLLETDKSLNKKFITTFEKCLANFC